MWYKWRVGPWLIRPGWSSYGRRKSRRNILFLSRSTHARGVVNLTHLSMHNINCRSKIINTLAVFFTLNVKKR